MPALLAVYVATPLEFKVALPSVVLPTDQVTVPVGVTSPAEVTVEVNATVLAPVAAAVNGQCVPYLMTTAALPTPTAESWCRRSNFR